MGYLKDIYDTHPEKYDVVITEELFYDKELSDCVRDIVKNSCISFGEAILYMKISNNNSRDSFIVKKMANVGYSTLSIIRLLHTLNS